MVFLVAFNLRAYKQDCRGQAYWKTVELFDDEENPSFQKMLDALTPAILRLSKQLACFLLAIALGEFLLLNNIA